MISRYLAWSTMAFGLLIPPADAADLPNILWLTSEDHGPQMGCYGDTYATTPNVDRLAAKGLRYTHAWSNAPVCAPARTTLISGMYPPSLGAEHMRSFVPFPQGKRMYPQYLRDAGYYCTNNSKEDYNVAPPGRVWDESSARAHWKNRKPGQPFFAVFNSTKSHESQVRARPHKLVHDPAKVRIPAYHPDTPETRGDWAQYYDGVTAADADAGRHLDELAKAGLENDTIVFYYADHGPGLPRSKRWPYDSGLHVPLVVFIPDKFKHLRPPGYQPGGTSDRLVSFVDFAPTVLSLAGVEPPEWMQGHAFLGRYQKPPQSFLFGFRGRMDERYDLVRTATDGRFVYIRNYMPQKIYGQYIHYMFEMPTVKVWKARHDAGTLTPEQEAFWRTKPPEELYDLSVDPDEVHNLANAPEHQATLARLREAQRKLATEIRDVGFLPEGEIHGRSRGSTPYDMGHAPSYPFARIFEAAELASSLRTDALPALEKALGDPDSAVRYWAVLGFLMRGQDAARTAEVELDKALLDPSPYVQVAAAETLAAFGSDAPRSRSLTLLAQLADPKKADFFVEFAALNAIDALAETAAPLRPFIQTLSTKEGPTPHERYTTYVPRVVENLKARFP